ncbi:MAG: PEP-CTERM sorting domain-containing protein [Phycisphaerales bacterium]|nr:PEP-CTERM sorting domain-containing protein [Phycisphaerales bacterium]
MSKSIRSFALAACVGAAAIVASAGSARAAYTYGLTGNSEIYRTDGVDPNNDQMFDGGNLYTTRGSPVVTDSTGMITFDFSNALSLNFSAVIGGGGSAYVMQTTDGHLVLDIHFDEPTSITVMLNEGGFYSTTGSGTVDVMGGLTVTGDGNAFNSSEDSLVSTFNRRTWTATATSSLTGSYSDYDIAIDNSLYASAPLGDSASIYKREFSIIIIVNPNNPPVPEPASLSLLGLGAGALLYRRRRN